MKHQKMYESKDKMISLIQDNYNLLQSLGRFGISLGFGDKTVQDVCESEGVDTFTFLAVVNYTINGYINSNDINKLSVSTLMTYLKASHAYYIEYQLPEIKKKLSESLDKKNNLAQLILKLYDEYARSIKKHMRYEEKNLFPYVEALLNKDNNIKNYNVETFSKHHTATGEKLKELKSIIIKYLPEDNMHSNKLSSTLYDIYNNEVWLSLHADVEDYLFVPAISALEKNRKQYEVSSKISSMINNNTLSNESLSDREKEIIVQLVQGKQNKEIAECLFISVNTVITHRRNISRKLQIHSPAGLTIYAIVNNLIDISMVNV